MAESSDTTTKTREAAILGDVEAVVRPVLEARGLELFELSFRLEQGGWVLRVTVDTVSDAAPDQGVTLDLCAGVARDVSTALDEADPLPHAYTLEVSSPGVERPLRTLAHYARFAGKQAKVTLLAPIEGASAVLRGTLAGVDGEFVLLDVGQPQPLSLALSGIKRANLVYELPAQPKKGSSKKKRRSDTERRD